MDSDRIIREHLTFRILLQAMSHPGRVYPLPDFQQARQTAVQLLSAIIDNEVSFAVIGDPQLARAVGQATGSRPVAPEDADYLIICNDSGGGKLTSCKRGSLEYPDNGATILYLVEELAEGEGDIVLSGPGIPGTALLRIKGLPAGDIRSLQEINSEFPLGIDTVFLDETGRIACIPRSSRIGVN